MACLSMCQSARRLATQQAGTVSRTASKTVHHVISKHLPDANSSYGLQCLTWCRKYSGLRSVRAEISAGSDTKYRHAARRGSFVNLPQSESIYQSFQGVLRAVHCAGPRLASHGGFGGDKEHSHKKDSDNQRKSQTPDSGWAVRLANENGYLSWCRNTYLTTVVGIAMLGEGTTAMAHHAAEGAFFVAGVNLSWGTYHFIYNILHLRRRMGMSFPGAFLQVSMASLHLLLWFMICILYIGYDDPEADSMRVQLKEEEKEGSV